jgi:hypothetical protein
MACSHRIRRSSRRGQREKPLVRLLHLLLLLTAWTEVIGKTLGLNRTEASVAIFHKIGESTHMKNFIDMRLDLDLGNLLALIKEALDQSETFKMKYPSHKSESDAIITELNNLRQRVQLLINMEEVYPEIQAQRPKRFIGLAIFFTITLLATTILSIYTANELANVKEEAEAQARTVELMKDTLEIHQTSLEDNAKISRITMEEVERNEEFMRMTMMKRDLEKMVNNAERIVQGGLVGRLDIAALDNLHSMNISEVMLKSAMEIGSVPLVQRPSDLLQCDVSFILESGIFSLIVHIPAAPPQSFLTVYKFIDLPVPIEDGVSASVHLERTYIAIDEEHEWFTTLSQLELNSCNHISVYLSCPLSNVVKNTSKVPDTFDEDFCLLMLFLGRHEEVEKLCNLYLHTPSAKVHQISENSIALMSPYKIHATLTCPGKRPSEIFLEENKLQMQTVSPGCILESQDFKFTAPRVGYLRSAWTVFKDLGQSFHKIIGNFNSTDYRKALNLSHDEFQGLLRSGIMINKVKELDESREKLCVARACAR